MKSALGLVLLSLGFVLGCAQPEGGDGGKETASVGAKTKVDASMSKADQNDLAARVKAWDPKKDKK